MRPCIAAEITDAASAKKWIEGLVAERLEFHFEDDPGSIVSFVNAGDKGHPTFKRGEVAVLRKRIKALYALPAVTWTPYSCPLGFVMSCTKERDRGH